MMEGVEPSYGYHTPNLNWTRVQKEASGAYPFENEEDAFGKYIAKIDPAGDPDPFKLACAMARQGYVVKTRMTGGGFIIFEYAPDEIEWIGESDIGYR